VPLVPGHRALPAFDGLQPLGDRAGPNRVTGEQSTVGEATWRAQPEASAGVIVPTAPSASAAAAFLGRQLS
jgi:hypothetical protein